VVYNELTGTNDGAPSAWKEQEHLMAREVFCCMTTDHAPTHGRLMVASTAVYVTAE
jgi:hypothetical protein